MRLLVWGAAVAVVAAAIWFVRPQPVELRLTQLLPDADGWLLEVPGSAPLVIDGGSDGTAAAVRVGALLPFQQLSPIALLLTRADHGLTAQLALAARYRVATALLPETLPGAAGTALHEALRDAGPLVPTAGTRLALGAARLTVLHAADGDDGGMLLLLQYGRQRIVLHSGGAAADDALRAVAAQIAPVDVLFYPWQRPSNRVLIAALQPRVIVYTVAYREREPVLQTFAERAVGRRLLYHPALDGPVTLISDGTRLRLETGR